MRLLYDIVFLGLALFYLPVFFIKGKHRGGVGARFGRLPSDWPDRLNKKKVFWVHAVSVGEALQALRFKTALSKKIPAAVFVLTATTTTGFEVLRKNKAEGDLVAYAPFDFSVCVRRFIETITPQAIIILETELWPNLISESAKRMIPLFIINGRISDRAIGKYRVIKHFLKGPLNSFSAIGAQDALMQSRFLELGAAQERVSVQGSMKFDWQPESNHEAILSKLAAAIKTPHTTLWVAGSTHEGEEETLFQIFQSIKSRYPFFKLLVAPRHLNRLKAIEVLAKRKGIALTRTSDILNDEKSPATLAGEKGVFILDSMGFLASLYSLADVVFVGGSLVPKGGHNLAEPAFFEKPILFGPFMNNFSWMAEEFKKKGAGVQAQNSEDLKRQMDVLLLDKGMRESMGKKAKRLILEHQGATDRNVTLVMMKLEEGSQRN